jgi:hypothetical protein
MTQWVGIAQSAKIMDAIHDLRLIRSRDRVLERLGTVVSAPASILGGYDLELSTGN